MVLPTLFFLILATVVGGYGVFRYQQIAMLAREGVRYASVHGGQYQQETGNTAATAQDVYNNAIVPYATSLDLTQLTYYRHLERQQHALHASAAITRQPTGNTVTVTVNYKWFPEVVPGRADHPEQHLDGADVVLKSCFVRSTVPCDCTRRVLSGSSRRGGSHAVGGCESGLTDGRRRRWWSMAVR